MLKKMLAIVFCLAVIVGIVLLGRYGIIAQARTKPEVICPCLKDGCTHSVGLNIAAKILGTNYQVQTDNGDGTGVLYDSIATKYRKWNNSGKSYGSWPASRIRAVLNGSDEYTADSTRISSELSIYYNSNNDIACTDMEGSPPQTPLSLPFRKN